MLKGRNRNILGDSCYIQNVVHFAKETSKQKVIPTFVCTLCYICWFCMLNYIFHSMLPVISNLNKQYKIKLH